MAGVMKKLIHEEMLFLSTVLSNAIQTFLKFSVRVIRLKVKEVARHVWGRL
jgi:hypothetical protein